MSHDGGMKVMELGMEASTVDTWSLSYKTFLKILCTTIYDKIVVKVKPIL